MEVDVDKGKGEGGGVEDVGSEGGSVTGEGRGRVDSRVLKEGGDQTLNTQKTTVTMAVLQNQKEKVEEKGKKKEIEETKGIGYIPEDSSKSSIVVHAKRRDGRGDHQLMVVARGSASKRRKQLWDGSAGACGSGGGPGLGQGYEDLVTVRRGLVGAWRLKGEAWKRKIGGKESVFHGEHGGSLELAGTRLEGGDKELRREGKKKGGELGLRMVGPKKRVRRYNWIVWKRKGKEKESKVL